MRRRLTVIAVLLSLAAATLSAQIYGSPGATTPGPDRRVNPAPQQRGPARAATQYYERGKALAERRDWERAIGELQRALEIEEDYVDALVLMGHAYREMNDPDRAMQYYQRAARYRPGQAETTYAIGQLALSRDNVLLAVREYLALRDSGSNRADEMWALIERYVRTHP